MRPFDQDLPAEFDGVIEQLHAHRAELSPLELDRIKITIKREKSHMKTRTSIVAVLVSGILFSGTGVALGVSGLAGSDSAGNAQYQVTPLGGGDNQPTVKGASETRAPTSGTKGVSATSSPAAVAQPSAQQSLDSGDSLPFTGYAAIPVLLIGLALLGTGVMMRRRSAADKT
jgi:hypothetical protein